MIRVMVRYKVRADEAAANERAIQDVFAQLSERQPPGIEYASFKLDDGVSFVHFFSAEAEDDRHALRALPAFQAFAAAVRDRCEEHPLVTQLTEVGSYRAAGVGVVG